MATEKSIYATGKRKNAIARTWIQPGTGVITVNDRPADEYFTVSTARTILRQPLTLTNNLDAFDIKWRLVVLAGQRVFATEKGTADAPRGAVIDSLWLRPSNLRRAMEAIKQSFP